MTHKGIRNVRVLHPPPQVRVDREDEGLDKYTAMQGLIVQINRLGFVVDQCFARNRISCAAKAMTSSDR